MPEYHEPIQAANQYNPKRIHRQVCSMGIRINKNAVRNNLLPKDRYTTIYALIDPVICKVFYIGSTCNLLSLRLSQHIRKAKSGECHNAVKSKIIRHLLSIGHKPLICELEVCTGYLAPICAEKFWIYQYGFVFNHPISNGQPHSEYISIRKRVSKKKIMKKTLK